MKYQFLQTKFAKLLLFCAVFGVFLSAFVSTTQAQETTVTFAQFVERTGSQDFRFTNNAGTSGIFDTVPGGSPIFFFYQNIAELHPSLQGQQNAHVFITTTTTTSATLSENTLTQPLNQTIVISILRDTPTAFGVGTGARVNLLTITISSNTATPAITGTDTGNSGTFSATTPDHTVTFTSDFVGFPATVHRNLTLGFSSITPTLALGAGNFLQSFTAAGTGTFASNPPPVAFATLNPTAATASVSGRIRDVNGKSASRVTVTLTNLSNGESLTTRTNLFGRYSFEDVPTGASYSLKVSSKRYVFSVNEIVINLLEDLTDANFTATSTGSLN